VLAINQPYSYKERPSQAHQQVPANQYMYCLICSGVVPRAFMLTQVCMLCVGVQVAEWLWGQVGGGEPAPALSVPMQLSQGLR